MQPLVRKCSYPPQAFERIMYNKLKDKEIRSVGLHSKNMWFFKGSLHTAMVLFRTIAF